MSSVTPADTPQPTRRERLRAELTAEIKAVARRQLHENGPSAVSWRGIAREVGMSPASLYTYFENLDELYTTLIVDSFTSHAAAIGRSIAAFEGRPLVDRLYAGMVAYRVWGTTHIGEFRLLYDNLLPDYAAPEDGPTVVANNAVGANYLVLLVEGWRSGELDPAPPGPRVDTAKMTDQYDIDITSDELRTAIGAWGMMHGLTALEVNNHLNENWIDAGEVYVAEMRTLCRKWGLPDPADDVAELAAAAAAVDQPGAASAKPG